MPMSSSDHSTLMNPPKGAQAAFARGLRLKEKYAGKGLQEETVAWAQHFADGQPNDAAHAKKMRAWFHRHAVDKKPNWDKPPTPGFVAWLLWGGDAGQRWVERIMAHVEREAVNAKKKPHARAK
jgi:hypothetical protein